MGLPTRRLIQAHYFPDSKFKVARGGGRHFSRDLDPRRAAQEEESSEEESSEEESSDEDDVPAGPTATLAPEMAALNLKLGNTEAVHVDEPQMSRADRKAMKKAQAAKQSRKQQDSSSGSEESSSEDDAPAPQRKAAPAPAAAKPKPMPAPVEQSRKEKYVRYLKLTARVRIADY